MVLCLLCPLSQWCWKASYTTTSFFLLLLFVIVATEAETVQFTHYKDFKTRRDLNLLMYSVCAALLICLNARDYTKVIILEALIRDGKVSKLGNFILEGAHWINPSVGQSRVVQSMA